MRTADQTLAAEASTSYSNDVEQQRELEFSRLTGKIYLDHAGAALYSERQLAEVFEAFKKGVFGNPHSLHNGLLDSAAAEDEARRLTLAMCNASAAEYDCIFTSGATGAIKLVAESFPWTKDSKFVYSKDNHTSVLGMREIAQSRGASAESVPAPTIEELENIFERQHWEAASNSLFAYPLESNFSGARYSSSLVTAMEEHLQPHREEQTLSKEVPNGQEIRQKTSPRWWILLDAAKACSTQPPNLSQHKPHLVALSYYKIFGYPTGLGALLVRKDAAQILQRRYFGGGTVLACSADSSFVRRREGAAGFEDGTNSYLGIAAISHGFNLIHRMGGFPSIHSHAQHLTRSLVLKLRQMRHYNRQLFCQIYGCHQPSPETSGMSQSIGSACFPGCIGQGPTVTCNFLRADGSFIGYREVEKVAELNGIMLRGGCLCNPGACAFHLGLSAQDIQENFEAGKVCWDDNDIVNGRPTGAVRISFGLSSSRADVEAVLEFLQSNFLETQPPRLPVLVPSLPRVSAELKGIWVYPVKSCGGCRQEEWPLGPNGLLFDREWALVGEDGEVLTLKKRPQLARIQTHISLQSGTLLVSAENMPHPLKIQLPAVDSQMVPHRVRKDAKAAARPKIQISLCAESVSGMQMAGQPEDDSSAMSAGEWFTQAVGQPCKLVQQQTGTRRSIHKSQNDDSRNSQEAAKLQSIGFANEAQLLLVNEASLQDLNDRLAKGEAAADKQCVAVERFRPNLLVGGDATPFCEDAWDSLDIGQIGFQVAGLCARCNIICVDPSTGSRKGLEPLYTLASYRRLKGQINFGVLLHLSEPAKKSSLRMLKTGMSVHADNS